MKNTVTIDPVNEAEWLKLRKYDITSTEVSALFGLSPYITKYELWHHKRDKTTPAFEVNERMKWGTRLQDAIAEGIAIDNSWKVRRMKEYMRNPKVRIGASFDYGIDPHGLLEIKNVDSLQFKQGWIVEGDYIEAPPHIELQIQHQLLVSGRQYTWLGALVGGNDLKLFERKADKDIHDSILIKADEFWASIEKDQPPAPDFTRDTDFLMRLNQHAEPGKVLSAYDREDIKTLAKEYCAQGEVERAAGKKKDIAKVQILELIGSAEKALLEEYTISAGLVGPSRVEAYDRKPYRNFRIFPKKEKA